MSDSEEYLYIDLNDTGRAKEFKKNQLFQLDAFREVEQILIEKANYLTKLEKLTQKDIGEDLSFISECRVHDSIFIAGDRGTGKTAFMLNIERYIQDNSTEIPDTFEFLKPIDPTLLEKHEDFISIVIGHVVDHVDNKCRSNIRNQSENESKIINYTKALNDISESLKAIKSNESDQGIEQIVSSLNSLKLEQHAHSFFRAATKVLKKRALVLLIDDIDMSLSKGFDVLEVVRKYLASPYLIPVISGDEQLYSIILHKHFEELMRLKDYNNKYLLIDRSDSEDNEGNEKIIHKVCERYLIKIFRYENRIYLRNIYDVLRTNRVVLEIGEYKIPYNVFKDIEIRLANLGINQKGFTQQVLTDNARELVQYLIKMKDEIEIMAVNFPLEKTKDRLVHRPYIPNLNYPSQPIEQNNFADMLPTFRAYDAFIAKHYFSDFGQYKLVMHKMANIYKFSTKRFFLYKCAENDSKAIQEVGTDKKKCYLQHSALKSDFFNRIKNQKYKPDPEYIIDDLYVSKRQYGRKINNIYQKDLLSYLVFRFFIHDDYYSSYQTKYLLVAGKFFELMIASLDPKIDGSMIKKILYSIPFNANIAKSRYIDEVYRTPNHTPNDYSEDDITEEQCAELAEFIKKEWQNKVELNKPSTPILNTHFVHTIANKYFNNVNILKSPATINKSDLKPSKTSPHTKTSVILSEDITTFMQRIAAIFLNSIASFESTRVVANTNIAISNEFSVEKLVSKDNAYKRNIHPLLGEATFTDYYFNHPIIKRILADDYDDIKGIKIGKATSIKRNPYLLDTGISDPDVFTKSTEALYGAKKYNEVLIKTIEFIGKYSSKIDKALLSSINNKNRRYQKSAKYVLELPQYKGQSQLVEEFSHILEKLNRHVKK